MGSFTASVVNAISDSMILGSISKTVKEVFQNEVLEELQPYVKKAICNMPPLSELLGDMLGFDFGGKQNQKGIEVGDEMPGMLSDMSNKVSSVFGE